MNTCLDSCHLAKPLLVANSPHPTHDAARPFGNRQGPTHSCWSRRRVFGRTPQLQGVPRKTINPSKRRKLNRHRSPQNSASTAVGPHEARRCAEDAQVFPPNQRQECATLTYRFEPPTRTSGSMRHILSEVAQVARAHRFAHCSSKPSVTRFSLVPLCSCVMRPC